MASLREVSGIPHDELGCVIVVEEALTDTDVETFRDAIAAQPPWSDLPLILLAGQETSVGSLPGRLFPESGNIALLQLPVHPIGLAPAVKVALRAPARQYQTRDLLADRASALRRRDEFLAMLAHELRNPLAPIRNAVHLLQTIPSSDPRVGKMRSIIEKQTK